MDFIYSRVSTTEQSVDGQLTTVLHRYPEAIVITETASGAKVRPALDRLIGRLQTGDRLIVAALDRLGRSLVDVIAKIDALQKRGVIIISIRESVDFTTPTGRLVMQVLLSVAELERGIIGERTKASLKAAANNGVKIGRPTQSPDLLEKVQALQNQGLSYAQIGQQLGISKSLVNYYVRKLRGRPARTPA
jgi:DNA invertase Pin-like site-specific DNA recombinase